MIPECHCGGARCHCFVMERKQLIVADSSTNVQQTQNILGLFYGVTIIIAVMEMGSFQIMY